MTDTFRKKYSQSPELKEFADELKWIAEKLQEHMMRIEPGRERSIAMTKLEEAVMWAVKAAYIAGDGDE